MISFSRSGFSALPPLLMSMLLGCGTSATPNAPAASTTTTSTTTKAPINGIVAMGNESFNTNPSLTPTNNLADPLANQNVYAAAVILVTWKQLQPTSSTSFDTSAIDSALATITSYNASHTKQMVGKLRVFAGQNTPTWAQNLDGAPLTGVIPSGATVSYPRYWTANYIAAWKNLQNLLAAKYDTTALLGEVAVSGCSSTTAEPFIHDTGTALNPLLLAAGDTDTQYMNCLSTMGDQYSAWTHTPLDYTFNTFQSISSGGVVTSNSAFTLQVMAAWRAALGTARGVIANHGLQPTLTPDAQVIYPEFTTLGPPIEFQSYGPTVDWNATEALAVSYKASELEVWTTTQGGGSATISLAQLQLWSTQI